MKHRAHNAEKGFTLLELVLVTAIFAITIVLAVDIFMVVTKVQRKAVSSQRLQGDARFVMELISKDVRLGQIDYTFYTDLAALCGAATTTPNPTGKCDVNFASSTDVPDVLAVRDTEGEQIVYRQTNSSDVAGEPWSVWDGAGRGMEVCIGDCLSGSAVWEVITPKGVKVVSAKFYVQPSVSPFIPTAGLYSSNEQPLVTIHLGTQGTGTNIEERGYIYLQTTVSTRIYER